MVQKALFGLGIILMLAVSQLFAQKQPSTLALKSGDWFEANIRIRNEAHTIDHKFDVRYEVSSKAPNGNSIFKVTIERMKLKYADAENTWFGYDSYYPRYIENRKKNLTKQIYEITADSVGRMSKLKPLSTAQKINFSLLSVRSKYTGPKPESSSERVLPVAHLKKISETIIRSLITGKALPKTFTLPESTGGNGFANAVLKAASFKLPTNAFIKGNIANLSSKDSIYAVNDEIFKFNKDGSFSANVLVGLNTRSSWVFGQFDKYKGFFVLLDPLDSLEIKADALDFDNTISFAGNAGAKALLFKYLVPVYNKQSVNESKYRSKSPEEFLAFQKQWKDEFDG